ncbi:MAG TPA: FAD-dependent monooxygenase [Frankiaceae bacterium]|nr:FAD-dependent monooxygenase [Frankiaceae bacterium]
MTDIHVPVLIAGGGGAGLTASMLLSTYGVEHLLVSSTATTSTLPKAHVLQQRAMEVFRNVGCADRIDQAGTPAENMSHTAWYLDVAGSEHAGRLIHKMEAWDGGATDPAWVAASPCRQTNLPQIRLEPLLKDRAEELNPGGIRFSNEVVALEQDDEGVLATVTDRTSGRNRQVRCDYLIAADGGRTIGKLLGVPMEGQRDVMRTVSVHMSADLSPWMRDPEVLIRWIVHTKYGGAFSVLVPMGPNRWGPDSEEWVFHMNFPPELEEQFDTDEKVLTIMRDRLGMPDFDPTIHKITRWSVEGLLASTIRIGRVFLVGDAAHRHPPTGGLGLNSAVHDVYNLCWKIAHVLEGRAGDALLDSYESERYPSFARNVQRSVENALNHQVLIAALGVEPGVDEQTCRDNVLRLWVEGPVGSERRRALAGVLASQSMEFKEHNVEFGFRAVSSAVVPDGSPEPPNEDDIRIYRPDTRPGSPLPHAWVERPGERRPLREVAPPTHWMLIAGEDGGDWCDKARKAAAERGIQLEAVRVGHLDGDWLDPLLAFTRVREFGRSGAILVRPDRVIAWRSLTAHGDSTDQIGAALDQVLAPGS